MHAFLAASFRDLGMGVVLDEREAFLQIGMNGLWIVYRNVNVSGLADYLGKRSCVAPSVF